MKPSYEELEQQLEESQREFRSADITMQNLEAKCVALAAENAWLKEACGGDGCYRDCPACAHSEYIEAPETPATDAFMAEVRAQGAEECVRQLVISDDDDFADAPNVCAMVARQLRQGGAE